MSLLTTCHAVARSPITTAMSLVTVSQSRASAASGLKAADLPRRRSSLGNRVNVCATFFQGMPPMRRLMRGVGIVLSRRQDDVILHNDDVSVKLENENRGGADGNAESARPGRPAARAAQMTVLSRTPPGCACGRPRRRPRRQHGRRRRHRDCPEREMRSVARRCSGCNGCRQSSPPSTIARRWCIGGASPRRVARSRRSGSGGRSTRRRCVWVGVGANRGRRPRRPAGSLAVTG